MAERLKAAVLKIASRVIVTGVRIPLPPFLFVILDYSRTEVNPPHPYKKVEAVAHEAVDNYREPTQPTRATTKPL